jgi:hypothetical protein
MEGAVMEYEKTISVKGDVQKAYDLIVSVIKQNGFNIKKKGDSKADFKRTGFGASTKKPIRCMSSGYVKTNGNQIKLKADLGIVRFLRLFIGIFPFALGIFLMTLFSVIFRDSQPVMAVVYALSPWVILSPLMIILIPKKIVRKLDRIMETIASKA